MTLTVTTTPGQSRPRHNGNEGVLYIPQIPRTGFGLVWFGFMEYQPL